MKKELARCIAAHHRLTAKQINKVVDAYVRTMLLAIGESYVTWGFQDDQLSLALTELRTKAGRVTTEKGEQWVLPLFHQYPDTSLVLIDFKGNVGKNSRVTLNPKYKEEIMDELINLHKELSPRGLREIKEKANTFVTVDPVSLESFICKTTETYRGFNATDKQGEKYRDALHMNITIAHQLMDMIQVEGSSFVLNEYWQPTDSGRMYGHGLSLQRVPEQVRHGALGRCHRYDFKASAYALLTGLAKQFEPDLLVGDMTDYIQNRSVIRASLAKQIGVSEKWMKAIFSAIGFGAKVEANRYNTVGKMLGPTKTAMLMANRQFQAIKTTFDSVTDVIDHNLKGEFELLGHHYSPIDPKDGSKRSKNQKLAWIYQVLESTASRRFAQLAADKGHEPLLWTHDCLYYSHPLSSDEAADIQYFLRKEFPYVAFEHESIWPIQADNDFSHFTAEADAWIAEHARFVEKEEEEAGPMVADPVAGSEFEEEIRALNPDLYNSGGKSIDLSRLKG